MEINEPKLRQLVQAFLVENAKLNLSAFRTEEHCWIGNVVDSVSMLAAAEKIKPLEKASRLLDIGTGGGFPLLPLAVCLPNTTCVGIDATKKKIDAVGRIVESLGLTNVKLHCGRTEELARQKEMRATFDIVTAILLFIAAFTFASAAALSRSRNA